jgi:hypothetical protein
VGVSLYQVQKLLFEVNRDRHVRGRFLDERERLVTDYALTADDQPVPAWSTGCAIAALEPR